MGILNSFTTDMGIDMGTTNTMVVLKDSGIVLKEPTYIAVEQGTGQIVAVGEEARQMLGRTPKHIRVLSPLQNGVIADYNLGRTLLHLCLKKVLEHHSLTRPRIILSVPYGVTSVERRAVIDAALEGGAKEAYLLDSPLAAALGAGIPIQDVTTALVMELGGGTTQAAVISQGRIVYARTLRLGGRELDEALVQYVKKKYNLLIGLQEAEQAKIEIGTVQETHPAAKMQVRGKDLLTGLPKSQFLDQNQVREAILGPVKMIIEWLRTYLEQMPETMAASVVEGGMVLTGGGALLRNLDWLLSKETGLQVITAENAAACTALGTGKAAKNMSWFRKRRKSRGTV